MARFYDPRRGKEEEPVDTPIGYKGRLNYDPQIDSGTSGTEVSDINPEHQYDVDLRRLGQDNAVTASAADTENQIQQRRVGKFLKATRLAGKYQQQEDIKYPIVGNQMRRRPAERAGVTLPSLGDAPGSAGSTNYANKPQPRSGKSYSWRDSFG